ncbi:hypothetical protein LX87_02980 [Larkinella arboricola]|uniref:Uncharacterized protein n=1 Tax=Larkinella arboricola TaxID=643671 RepID=A0A327WXK0_LARAB|nr:DUF5522 domain-containing protein [Larkinella arboricola]RAJ98072.1 hypothetical protein LX87_02980 [Larkinella arboricola]
MLNTNSPKPRVDGLDDEDYYFNEQGYLVFTAAYHLKRGYCCKNGCKHCPWRRIKGQE